jgi:hypothetical protein
MSAAVYRKDGAGVVDLLRAGAEPPPVWQLVGDGLLVALAQQVEGAAPLAAECAAALRRRGWTGDAELADQLVSDVPLRPLPVELEMLGDMLEGDPVTAGGVLDLETGETWPRSVIDDTMDDASGFDDEERFLWLDGGSRDGYHDMVAFIDTVADETLAGRLAAAIRGKGAFRRFGDVLHRAEDELSRWSEFSPERRRGRARAVLAEAGYRVARS